jgi:hypothetical protein
LAVIGSSGTLVALLFGLAAITLEIAGIASTMAAVIALIAKG